MIPSRHFSKRLGWRLLEPPSIAPRPSFEGSFSRPLSLPDRFWSSVIPSVDRPVKAFLTLWISLSPNLFGNIQRYLVYKHQFHESQGFGSFLKLLNGPPGYPGGLSKRIAIDSTTAGRKGNGS